MPIETVKLSTGASMPILGLGTLLSNDEAEFTVALRTALDSGYRLIDTAYLYETEATVGKVLQEYFISGKLKREDVFITTKLPFTAHAPDDVEKCVNVQLQALQTDYIDLYLIHFPVPFQRDVYSFGPAFLNDMQIPLAIDHMDTWRAMEKLYDDGKLKAIGLSNFNAKQIQHVYDNARIKPANLQVECHLYWPQTELLQLCKKLNMTLTANSPLGSRGRDNCNLNVKGPEGDPLTDPLVKELAAKYKKTEAQILLRFLIQQGINVIPKSIHPDRVKENMAVFDFSLGLDDMKRLFAVKTRVRLLLWDFAIGHPFYPFEDVDQSKLRMASIKS